MMELKRNRNLYLREDTIAALSTSLGGAIALIRISGNKAYEAACSLLASRSKTHEPWRAYRERLINQSGKLIDDSVMIYFQAPRSFTGEDVVELSLHGSSFIVTEVLSTLETLGVRQALPGEFSFRAVKNGKMTLFEAQALPDLIESSNEQALTLALDKLTGNQSEWSKKLSHDLKQLCMFGEVGIDFSDQNIDELELDRLKERITPIENTITSLKESYQRGVRIQEGISVALVGLPNAGKSSFFNALLGEDRSIVSETAGTTRDEIKEKITLSDDTHSMTFYLSDTAGLRESTDQIEQTGVSRSIRAAESADLVLFVIDLTQAKNENALLWQKLEKFKDKTLIVFTKSDLVHEQEKQKAVKEMLFDLGIENYAITSSKEEEGIKEAASVMMRKCQNQVSLLKQEVVLTRQDHYLACKEALVHLNRAKEAQELDLFASDIKQTLHSLDILIGETVPDDILGKIFSEFCIGK